MSLSYEEQRLQNIRDNQALLLSLGLSTPERPSPFPKKAVPRTPKTPTPNTPTSLRKLASESARKRRLAEDAQYDPDQAERDGDGSDPDESPLKRRRGARGGVVSSISLSPSPRRSGRNSLRKNYSEDGIIPASPRTPTRNHQREQRAESARESGSEGSEDEDVTATPRTKLRNNAKLGERIHDPKTFGHIPEVEVGKRWATRMECSRDAIHAPFVAGISGNGVDGAYSVALSGGYADDIDLGVAFTYTGCGGRDLKGTKQNPKNLRTAPQTSHQTFSNPMNAALKRSAETRLPVRVIRGFKLDSPYAPAEGYRYDGLYVVERAWMAKGLTNGLLVCRYAFKRCKGQPDLPIKGGEKGGLEVRDDNEGEQVAKQAEQVDQMEQVEQVEQVEQKADGVAEQSEAMTMDNGHVEEEKQEPVEESGPGVSDARPSAVDGDDDGCGAGDGNGDGEQEIQSTSNRVDGAVGEAAAAMPEEGRGETVAVPQQTEANPVEPAEAALEVEPSQDPKPARENSWSAWGLVGKILGRA